MSSRSVDSLSGLPSVLPFESPASWLSRAAQSQGVGITMFLKHLGLRRGVDVDLVFLSGRFQRLARACGLGPEAFSEARKVMASLRRLDPGGGSFLYRRRHMARYRICPRCLASQHTPHFGLQCRLEAWRHCPEHGCMMEDACWRCGQAVELPISPGIDGPRKANCYSLAQCVRCGAKHRDGPTTDFVDVKERLDPLERAILLNGAALPAALFQRRVRIQGGAEHSLAHLRQLNKMGLLARKGYGPTAARWRAREVEAAAMDSRRLTGA